MMDYKPHTEEATSSIKTSESDEATGGVLESGGGAGSGSAMRTTTSLGLKRRRVIVRIDD